MYINLITYLIKNEPHQLQATCIIELTCDFKFINYFKAPQQVFQTIVERKKLFCFFTVKSLLVASLCLLLLQDLAHYH